MENIRDLQCGKMSGAFSSNGGEDFRCVLEEFCKIKDADLSVPKPEKWTKAGEIMGENFSVDRKSTRLNSSHSH